MLRTTYCAALVAAVLTVTACGSEDLKGAPDVEGLALPEAKTQLEQAGFSASVKTDAMFGVIIESNFTVCKEKSPKGKLVPLEVSKQC